MADRHGTAAITGVVGCVDTETPQQLSEMMRHEKGRFPAAAREWLGETPRTEGLGKHGERSCRLMNPIESVKW